jgi:predicted PolB exonuclease-like 3'-5' exonuclease
VLSSFNPLGKATLHELSRAMGLPGKPEGISGSDVETFYRAVRIREIADYCESDVVNTYRIWLRYELFRERLTQSGFDGSEAALLEFINSRGNAEPHLANVRV